MIGYLYTITNNINGKVYVGKTYKSVNIRWKEHLNKSVYLNTKLYVNIRKYGKENFSVTEIASYPQGVLEEKEVLLIAELDSFKNGYNSTLGGEGKRTISIPDSEIIRSYLDLKSLNLVATKFSVSNTYVKDRLSANNIDLFLVKIRPSSRKRVLCLSLKLEFESLQECAEYLINMNIASGTIKSICSSLTKACTGSRKTYKKLEFTYI